MVADAPLDRYGEARSREVSRISNGCRARRWRTKRSSNRSLPRRRPADEAVHDLHERRRALEHVRGQRSASRALVKRVANHQEWGVRVVLDRTRAAAALSKKATAGERHRRAYLARKKAQRDASKELASRAQGNRRRPLRSAVGRARATRSAARRASCPRRADRCCSMPRFSCRARARRRSGSASPERPGARAPGLRSDDDRAVAALHVRAGLIDDPCAETRDRRCCRPGARRA